MPEAVPRKLLHHYTLGSVRKPDFERQMTPASDSHRYWRSDTKAVAGIAALPTDMEAHYEAAAAEIVAVAVAAAVDYSAEAAQRAY